MKFDYNISKLYSLSDSWLLDTDSHLCLSELLAPHSRLQSSPVYLWHPLTSSPLPLFLSPFALNAPISPWFFLV